MGSALWGGCDEGGYGHSNVGGQGGGKSGIWKVCVGGLSQQNNFTLIKSLEKISLSNGTRVIQHLLDRNISSLWSSELWL